MIATRRVFCLLLALLLTLALWAPSAYAAQPGLDNFVRQRTYTAGIFSDVAADHWSYDGIAACYEYGLMQGRGEVFDRPASLTVAEALTMADRIHEIYQTGASTLAPAAGSRWYTPYVDYALEQGIIGEEDFSSYSTPITRADMAYIFARSLPAEELAAAKTVVSIPDITQAPARDRGGIWALYRAGVLLGNDTYGTFAPASTITRQEAAAILARVALPGLRREDILLQKVTAGPLVFGLPQSGEAASTATNTGSTMYRVDGSGVVVDLYRFTDGSLTGRQLTDILTPAEEKGVLEEKSGAAWMEDCAVTAVKFGPVSGYRSQGRYVSAQYDYPMLTYRFLVSGTLYRFTVTWNPAAADQAVVDQVCASLTVDGHRADPLP